MASADIALDDDQPAASESWIASFCTSIQVLGSILAFYTLSAELRTLLLLPNMRSSCVVSTCDAILRSFKYPAKSPLLMRGSRLEALTDSLDEDTKNELIKDVLCLLSNLCYQHSDAQVMRVHKKFINKRLS